MKWLLLIAVVVSFFVWRQWANEPVTEPTATTNPTTPAPEYKIVSYNNDEYGYEIFRVSDLGNLKLIANYNQKEFVEKLMTTNNCVQAINGGFYGEDDQPLGLVIIAGRTVKSVKQSKLFNGFVSFNAESARIGNTPWPAAQNEVQTGPLLVQNNQVLDLQLVDDKLARRMFAVQTGNTLVFGSVFNTLAPILGPRLDDLPYLVETIAKQEKLTVSNAINLDGGRASAFYSSDLKLPEVTWVGSLFCNL